MVVFNPVKAFIILALAATVSGDCTAMLNAVNAARRQNGVSPDLVLDQRLINAAQKHSDLMAQQQQMEHQLPGEDSFDQRITNEGYIWSSVGENIAFGYKDIPSVMDGWMNSPGHRANILNTSYKQMGCGETNKYWTQDFGSLRSGSVQPPSSSPSTTTTTSTTTTSAPTTTTTTTTTSSTPPPSTPPPSNPPPSNPSPSSTPTAPSGSNGSGRKKGRHGRHPRRVVHNDNGYFAGFRARK